MMNRQTMNSLRSGAIRASLLAAALCLPPPALAQALPAANEIVTLPEAKPERPNERNPTAQQLVESWLGGFIQPDNTRFAENRYEIIAKRVVWGEFGQALLQARMLPLEGDAAGYAASRCNGRTKPLEFQLFYQWSNDINAWVAMADRGIDGVDPCIDEPLWTADEIEKIVAPPPRPKPPQITKADVRTPKAGSPERKAIMDALRPSFEKLFGPPIEFKVSMLTVAAGFAWASVHPQRPGGQPISAKDWKAAVGPCEQNRADAVAQFWMYQANGKWQIGWGEPNDVCATDSIGDMGFLIGAPAQLVDRDDWGDSSLAPVENPQYFKLWWLQKRP